MGEHSDLMGGSSALRRINCPASYVMEKTTPQRPDSKYAADGTLGHEVAEWMLVNRRTDTMPYIGRTLSAEVGATTLTKELLGSVQKYINGVYAELALTPDAEMLCEIKLELNVPSAAKGEIFGKFDAIVYHPSRKRLRVFDYKQGYQPVDAALNAQLTFGAVAAVQTFGWDVEEIILTIVQPNAADVEEKGAVRDYVLDPIDLQMFLAEVERAAHRCKAVEATFKASHLHANGRQVTIVDGKPADSYPQFVTGSHCRWCNASALCPQRQAEALADVQGTMAGVDLVDVTPEALPIVSELSLERLGQLAKAGMVFAEWFSAVQQYVSDLSLAGTKVPGFKVVNSQARAKFISDPADIAAYAALEHDVPVDEMTPRKLVGITEAKKVLKSAGASKDEVETFLLKFTLKEPAGKLVVPDEDPRPAVDVAAVAFATVDMTALMKE